MSLKTSSSRFVPCRSSDVRSLSAFLLLCSGEACSPANARVARSMDAVYTEMPTSRGLRFALVLALLHQMQVFILCPQCPVLLISLIERSTKAFYDVDYIVDIWTRTRQDGFLYVPTLHTLVGNLQMLGAHVDGSHCFLDRLAARLQPIQRALNLLRQALELFQIRIQHLDFSALFRERCFARRDHAEAMATWILILSYRRLGG